MYIGLAMPITTTCPECRRDLRVPDQLFGKPVRCPHCRTEFTAGELPSPAIEPSAPTEPAEPEPLADTLAKREPAADAFRSAEGESAGEAPAPGPLPLPPRPDLDEDDEEDDDDFYAEREEGRLRRMDRASYEHAKQRVLPPAICLMVVGGINLLFDGFRIVMAVVQFATMPAVPPPGPGAPFGGGMEFMIAFTIMSIAVSIIWGMLVVYGGIKLKQLRSYGMVLTGCIFAMLPCINGCCILGLPFAIWTLVLIHDEQIRRHFSA